MSIPKELVPLAAPLSAVQRLLERLNNQGVIYYWWRRGEFVGAATSNS